MGTSDDRPSRRTFLIGAAASAVLVAVPDAARAASTAHVSVRYFVRADGDDRASGRTDASAWRTLERVNDALAAGAVVRGDTVVLRRGQTFPGQLRLPDHATSNGSTLHVGAYGAGARPIVSGYKTVATAAAWSAVSPGVWSLDLRRRSGAYTGNVTSSTTDVGFVKADGEIHGLKRWALADLRYQWDFYSDTTHLYVRLATNPSEAGRRVDIAVRDHLVESGSYLDLSNLDLVGGAAHGVRSPSTGLRSARIHELVIREIGGGELKPSTQIRFGNGIEAWIGSSDVLVDRCSVSQVYDTAFTIQGSQSATARGWTNVVFSNNTAANCTQSFEVWASGGDTRPGRGMVRCRFVGNTCTGAGRGWGAGVRPDTWGTSTHLLSYGSTLPMDLEISGNTFIDAAQNYSYLRGGAPKGMRSHGNTIRLHPQTLLQCGAPQTSATAPTWIAATGLERGSRFIPLAE